MSNEVKTYRIDDYSVKARDLDDAVKRIKETLDVDPETILKEIDEDK